jgi:hypothetical protein
MVMDERSVEREGRGGRGRDNVLGEVGLDKPRCRGSSTAGRRKLVSSTNSSDVADASMGKSAAGVRGRVVVGMVAGSPGARRRSSREKLSSSDTSRSLRAAPFDCSSCSCSRRLRFSSSKYDVSTGEGDRRGCGGTTWRVEDEDEADDDVASS